MHAGTQGFTPTVVEANLDTDYRLLAGGYVTGKSGRTRQVHRGLASRTALS